MTAQSKLSESLAPVISAETAQQLRDLAHTILTMLPEVSQTLPEVSQTLPEVSQALPEVSQALPPVSQALPQVSQALPVDDTAMSTDLAPGQFKCTPPSTATAEDVTLRYCKLKVGLRTLRKSNSQSKWQQSDSLSMALLRVKYLQCVLRGIVLMAPREPVNLYKTEAKWLRNLERSINNMVSGIPEPDPLNVVDINIKWREIRKTVWGKKKFIAEAPWPERRYYLFWTIRHACAVAQFLACTKFIADCDGRKECADISGALQWRAPELPPKETLVTCRECPDLSDIESVHSSFAAKWKGITHIIDNDKVDHMRVALPLCKALASNVMHQLYRASSMFPSMSTSKAVYRAIQQLMLVVGEGVNVTSNTNVAIEKEYFELPTLSLCDGKKSFISRVKFLTVLLKVCTRVAVCFGNDDDKDTLKATYALLADNVSLRNEAFVKRLHYHPKYASSAEALAAYRKNTRHNRVVDEPPMYSADEAHTAVMLEVACALHKHCDVHDGQMATNLRALRLNDDKSVKYPDTYTEPDKSDVVSLCCRHDDYLDKHRERDVTPESAPAVTKAIFAHALKCLKQIPVVTDPALVDAMKNVEAYGASL